MKWREEEKTFCEKLTHTHSHTLTKLAKITDTENTLNCNCDCNEWGKQWFWINLWATCNCISACACLRIAHIHTCMRFIHQHQDLRMHSSELLEVKYSLTDTHECLMWNVKCVWAWRIHEHSSAEINKGNIWKSTLAHTDSLMIPMHFHWIALFRWSLIYAHNFATAAFNINQCLRMQQFVQTYKHIHMLCFHF